MSSLLDIPYIHSPERSLYHRFDLHLPHNAGDVINAATKANPLICFVHGGAWRSEDKSDHVGLARSLADAIGFAVAVPNYRLTGSDHEFQHPGHAEDILHFLTFLLNWEGPEHDNTGRLYDPTKLYLMGHSCSAHMLASIFLDTSPVTPSLLPSTSLLQSVQGIVTSEGIFDIDLLLVHFPSYRDWFIEPTFGDLAAYSKFSVNKYPFRNEAIRWLVVHSQGDTLVDVAQSEAMLGHLRDLKKNSHQSDIHANLNRLRREHNDILKGDPIFVDIVRDFILTDDSKYNKHPEDTYGDNA
ncbi:alpha/beta-hydrolase, partial [Pluteus cervinus]